MSTPNVSVPVHLTTVQKQGDGSHIVRVIHNASGHSTDVTFPYTAHSAELAAEYAAWKNSHVQRQQGERERVADRVVPERTVMQAGSPFGIPASTQAKPVAKPPVVNTATPVAKPPVKLAVVPTAPLAIVVPEKQVVPAKSESVPTVKKPEVVKVPVPAGDHNSEVVALEKQVREE